jgi:general secretion pathway protein D
MRLRYLRVIPAICALILVVQLYARTRQGDRYLREAQAAEARKDWDRAVENYQKAFDEDPRDSSYIIGLRRVRFQGAQEHVRRGLELRGQGNMAEAIAEFQRAILMDPSSGIALQELKRTQDMLASGAGAAGGPVLTPTEQALKEEAERVAKLAPLPQLQPMVRRVGPLKMNNQQLNILYNTVAAIAGISVVYDSTWNRPTRTFDVELPEMAVEDALDYLALVTRTYWKPLTPTTIFVTEESANKRRDFEDNVVKTFYVTNATTVQEFQEIQTAIRTLTDIRRMYPYNPLKALVVRGPADAVALTEKLIRDLDRPKAEVVIDVFVMEANSARTRDLAATIANLTSSGLAVNGISSAISFVPRGAATTGTGASATPNTSVSLARLGSISSADFRTTLPGALLQAMLTDSSTRLISSPQVRASDGQKGTLRIGDRVPIATGSFQSGVGGVGAFPGVNTQFQYIEVGVNVDITPQVHSLDELSLHVEIEVSNVRSYVDLGNIQQPVIRQDKSTADLRLKEGEINILAGLQQQQDSRSINGIPGLVNLPVLGKWLFGSEHIERDRGELMIALVPHIIRTPNYSPENLRGIFAGYDQQLDLRYRPEEPPEGSAPEPAKPAAPPPATVPQAAPAKPEGAAAAPAPPASQARITFLPGVVTVARNAPFTVNVNLEGASDLLSIMPLRVTWDPALLRLNDIAPAELLTRDGGRVTSVKDIRNDMGQATLSVSRPAGSPGISGSGTVATLTFVATGPGSGAVTVAELGLTNTRNQQQSVTLGAVPVAVQ